MFFILITKRTDNVHFGDTIYQVGDPWTELIFDLLYRDIGILNYIVQHRRSKGFIVESQLVEYASHGKCMVYKWLAGSSSLAMMSV